MKCGPAGWDSNHLSLSVRSQGSYTPSTPTTEQCVHAHLIFGERSFISVVSSLESSLFCLKADLA